MMRRTVVLMMLAVTLAGCADDKVADDAPDELITDDPVFVESVPVVLAENGTEVAWDFTGPYSRTLTEGTFDILAPQHVVLTSDIDGSTIEMGLWLPDGEGPFPVLMFSSPYFSVAGRPVTNPGGPSSSVGMLIDEIVPHGYAFATHAVRGTAGSGGCNDLMGPLETADIDQAIDEGFDDIQTLKRYSTVTMGPCQATGSRIGAPEISRKRMPSGPAVTVTSSPVPKRTSVRSPL